MGKLNLFSRLFGGLKGFKIGEALGSALKSFGSLLGKIKIPALKLGGFGVAFTGAVWGIKEFVGNVFQAGSDLIHDVVKSATGVDLSSGSSNMILAGILCVSVVGITVFYLRRRSRR